MVINVDFNFDQGHEMTNPQLLTAGLMKQPISAAVLPSNIAEGPYNASSRNLSAMSNGFIKLIRSDLLAELIKHPNDLALLILIATRAKRHDCPITGLKAGQAMIGDYKTCGMTHREYRTTSKRLTTRQIVTLQATNKGTIATILDTSVIDLNISESDNQKDKQWTNQAPNKDNKQEVRSKNKEQDKSCPDTAQKRRSRTTDKLLFDLENNRWEGITEEDLKNFAMAYPGAALEREIIKSAEWLKSNPMKAKSKRLWRKFLTNWLQKASDMAINREAFASTKNAGAPQGNREWAAQFEAETPQAVAHCGSEALEVYAKHAHGFNAVVKYDDKAFKQVAESNLRKVGLWKEARLFAG